MSWKRLLGGCVLFFVVAANAAQMPVALDDVVKTLPRSDVSGQVVDHKGDPIARADVWLYYARGEAGLRDRLAGQVKTGADGAFSFEQAVVWEPQTEDSERFEPHYSVIARHPDHGLYFANLFEGDAADQVTLVLTPRETRTVTVKDPNGVPVAGATVFICGGRLLVQDCEGKDRKYTRLRVNQDLGIVSAKTDDQGKATGTVLDDGTFLVTKPGYKKTWVPGKKAVLFPGASVSGIVRYPDGTPAGGAAVWYSYSGDRLVWNDVTVADANGHYEFAHVAAAGFYYSWMNPDDEAGSQGDAAVKADDLRVGSSFLSKKETFTIKPGERLEKDLMFADSVTLSGQIIDLGTNQPAPHMGLRLLTRAAGQSLDSKTVVVDRDGRFSVAVAPGSHVQFSWEESRKEGLYLIDEVWRRQGNYSPSFRQEVDQDVTNLAFKVKLVPLQPISGRATDAQGQGVAKATVYLHSDLPPVKTDDNGFFSFKGAFATKAYDIYAESSDQALAGITHIEEGGKEAKIVLHPTQDYKGLVSSTDGVPAGDLKFYLDLKINDSTVYRVRREPKTNDQGQFDVMKLCPAARYYAWWSSDNEDNRDYDYGNADIDLTSLPEAGLITFQAKQYLNVIMGTVTDAQAQPVAKANIRFESYDLTQQSERNRQIVTDDQGDFEIPRLAPGTANLLISAPGYVSKRFQVPTDTIDFEAEISKDTGERHFRIQVTDGNAPMPDVPVRFYTSQRDKQDYSNREVKHTDCNTDAQGQVELTLQLDTEAYQYDRILVVCDVKGYDLVYLGFQAHEDVDTSVTLKKSAGHWWSLQVQDQAGQPLPEAIAQVETVQFEGRPQAVFFRTYPELNQDYEFKADVQGRITIERFNLSDTLNLAVRAPGYAKMNHWASRSQPGDITVQLLKAGMIAGKVINRDGAVPPELRVYGHVEGVNQSVGPEPIDAEATFKFENCVPGRYVLRLLAGEASALGALVLPTVTAKVQEGETTDVTFELENGTLVSGKVIDKQTGEIPKDLTQISVSVPVTNSFSRLEEDGSWKFYLPEGNHMISYRYQRKSMPFKAVDVKKGEPIKDLIIEVETKAE